MAGVTSLDALSWRGPGHERARELLTDEVVVTTRALLASGFSEVRVLDTHNSGAGASNLSSRPLPAGAVVHWTGGAYPDAALDDVDAVACLGMHAAAAMPGFAAHTGDPWSRWSLAGRNLSETDLVLALAAERELPALFVSGDAALGELVDPSIPFVATGAMRPEEALVALDTVAREAPRPARLWPAGPLRLDFKRAWQAELAERAGGRRLGARAVEVPAGGSARERINAAQRLAELGTVVMLQAVRGAPGDEAYLEDVRALFEHGFDDVPAVVERATLREAAATFVATTADAGSEARALRALTLHMLEGHAPATYADLALGAIASQSVAALAQVPTALEPTLEPLEAQARLDAWWLRRELGLATADELDNRELVALLAGFAARGFGLFAWLLSRLAKRYGQRVPQHDLGPVRLPRIYDLYRRTHEVLLATRYLRFPPEPISLAVHTERLLLATPWLIAHDHLDLVAEVAFCLQAVGEADGAEHDALIAALSTEAARRAASGEAHLAAGRLIALAGARERAARRGG